jgi:23S rRNA (cytosine1962-C5)-methyltransferase
MQHAELYLKKNEDKRLSKGHLWIFSNEVDSQRTPLDWFKPGDLVNVVASNGKQLGTAFVNPHSLICARLVSARSNMPCDLAFFKDRIATALGLREKLFEKPYYRLIYGESDGLPGLVIDRFGQVLSVQINTAGMEKRQDVLVAALLDLLAPTAIILKNENTLRQLEGLAATSGLIYGQFPDELIIEENGAKFVIDVLGGQKTGWFYDHRTSRAQLAEFAANQRVLDLFSYSGAWAMPAALAGAREVVCVDASDGALNLAQQNARLNQVQDRLKLVRSDVFDYLKQARQQNEVYDIIVLDPPALIKRKKDFKQGYEAYRRLNFLALQLLANNGILVSASCSHHLSGENLHEILRANGQQAGRHLRFFAIGGQGFDHPIVPAMPETAYLKTFFCAVSGGL